MAITIFIVNMLFWTNAATVAVLQLIVYSCFSVNFRLNVQPGTCFSQLLLEVIPVLNTKKHTFVCKLNYFLVLVWRTALSNVFKKYMFSVRISKW